MASFRAYRSGWPIAITISALVTGCMVGPNYHPPKTEMPAKWVGTTTAPTTQMSVTTGESAEIARWWRTFNDPILESLITRAMESNLDLRQATARILQARAQRDVVAAGFWPTANANGSFQSRGTGVSGGPGGSSGFNVVNSHQVALQAVWELDVFGRVRRGIEAGQADIQAAIENRRGVLVTLAGDVASNYVQLRGFQQQIVIAKKNLDIQRSSAGIVQTRFNAKFQVTGLDVANAEAQVATTSSQIPALESQAQQTIYALSVLLGREPAALLRELTPEAAIPTTPPVVPVGLPSDLLRRRPDIRAAEAQLHAATANIGVATADLFPKFSLTGNGGFQSPTLKGLGNWDNRFWGYGPSVTWTIFDAGRIFSNIRVQDALQMQAFIAWQKTILTGLQDVESALIAYEKEQQRRAALEQAVVRNRKAVQIARLQYQVGQTEFLNLLNAQTQLNLTEDALVQSNRNIALDLIALYRALGGGWEHELESRAATTRPAP